MSAYADGDHAAFQALYRALGTSVHRFFLSKLDGSADADDLRQITFLKLHKARKTYRKGAPVRPWLFTIASRVCADELRRRYRRAGARGTDDDLDADSSLSAPQESALDKIERASLAAAVRSAIRALPETQRRVIELHRYQELPYKEIAARCETTEAAIKLRAFRAYRRLRERLADRVA